MISRRALFFGVTTVATAVISSSAHANSLLFLLGIPEPGLPAGNHKLPRSIKKARPASAKAKVRSKKATNAASKTVKSKKPFKIDQRFEPQEVVFTQSFAPGTIVVNSRERFLYLVTGSSSARRYGVAIGKEGLGWTGTATIKVKAEWPSWTPTAEMIARSPKQYARYKNGMPGGSSNPLGARALYLYQGKRDTSIRIHGTTQPWSIGQAASNGCFRMVNEHVIDLYSRVKTGTKVVVL